MFEASHDADQVAPARSVQDPYVRADVPASPEKCPRINSKQLLGYARDLIIEHAGQEYCLHLTRNGKLILTK